MMEFRKKVSRSEAKNRYKIITYEKNNAGAQASYNLPNEFLNFAVSNKIIIEKDKNEKGGIFIPNDDYKFYLGNNIYKLIGDQYRQVDNRIELVLANSNGKLQLIKTQFIKNHKDDIRYRWFDALYENNIEGNDIIFTIDTINKTLVFNVEFCINSCNDNVIRDDSGDLMEFLIDELNRCYLMYNSTGIHLFGFDHFRELESPSISIRKIVENSDIKENPSYYQEIRKGMNLAKLLDELGIISGDTFRNQEKLTLLDSRADNGINRIYYGLPGCGKSFYVQNTVLKSVDKNNIFRTTFYLEYSNSDFIGQIIPKVKGDSVTYQPIFGPFTKALKRAYETTDMVYLIIEEINRGNAAAIFGDLFQLLDRKKDAKDDIEKIGDSEYPITNSFLEDYLGIEEGRVIIPSNLTIYATMNTSDQNIFPLDTAFKRRWQLERVVNTWKKHPYADKFIPGTNIKWSQFVGIVNQHLISDDEGFSLEDKQIGAYFADQSMLCDNADEIDEEKQNAFCHKVIEYIWSDISKFHREYWFDDYKDKKPPRSFDELIMLMTDYKLNILVPFRDSED